MTEETKKPGRKPKVKAVYCLLANLKTSAGRIQHGDTVELPETEAKDLIAKGVVK